MIIHYILAVIGLAAFFLFADKRRFKELYPVILATAYLRFVEQYIAVDILHIWTYRQLDTPVSEYLGIPVLVDLFFYPLMGYLYVQYYPKNRISRLLYALIWSAGFTLNEQFAAKMGVIEQRNWHWFYSFLQYVAILVILIWQHNFFRRSLPTRQDEDTQTVR